MIISPPPPLSLSLSLSLKTPEDEERHRTNAKIGMQCSKHSFPVCTLRKKSQVSLHQLYEKAIASKQQITAYAQLTAAFSGLSLRIKGDHCKRTFVLIDSALNIK